MKRVQKILGLLQKSDDGFDKFIVMDLLKRAKLTIERIKDNEVYKDFDLLQHDVSMKQQSSDFKYMKEYTNIENVLEPGNLNVLTLMFLNNGFLNSVDLAEVIVALFDLHLIFASLFYYDRDCAHDISVDLIN